ncbi:MAG: hypothetical protein ACI9K2_006630 [Myxococcota bacterium]|jgi:hypothetical protein
MSTTKDAARPPSPPSEIETMASYAKLLRDAASVKKALGDMVRATIVGTQQGRGGLSHGRIRLSWQRGEAVCGHSGWVVRTSEEHGPWKHEATGATFRAALENLPAAAGVVLRVDV